jgi:hypothetical protein
MKRDKHEDDDEFEADFQNAKKNFRQTAEFQVAKKTRDESTPV